MIEPATGYWLAGLIDGEGCFRVQANHSRTRGVETYATSFTLKLRDDDELILRTIIALTGIGRYAHDSKGRGNSRPCSVWVVDTRGGCAALVTLLDAFPLRTRKARDYAVWREAVEEWTNGERGNRWDGPRDWTRMGELQGALVAAREYGGR